MDLCESKVYHDGSHYIAIRKTTNPFARMKPKKTKIDLVLPENVVEMSQEESEDIDAILFGKEPETIRPEQLCLFDIPDEVPEELRPKKIGKREIFDRVYRENYGMPYWALKKILIEEMRPYCSSERNTENYVTTNIRRKKRNFMLRRIRCLRKANLQKWDYFVTFTYDDKKQTEKSFRKKLTNTLSHLSSRKGWKYMGVWERGTDTNRLHFHAMLSMPEGSMPGELIKTNGYSFRDHTRRETMENSYFKEMFGRNDFEDIETRDGFSSSINYLLKYIEKSGERIVFSRKLPTFFISDILDEDVIMEMKDYMNEYVPNKYILFDNFRCIDMGEIIGRVCKKIIARMRYAN